jgi:acetolactate synthase-1/2/3 large subunit
VHLARAANAVITFADNNRIPVVCTMMGIGVMKSNDPMFFGMVGNNGNAYGNRAMNEADMIIMVGARVADRSISQPDLITENKTLVHIDVDPAEIGKNAGPEIPLVGDIASVFEVFNQQDCDSEYSEWVDRLKAYKKETEDKKLQKLLERVRKSSTVTPEEFIIELCQKLKDDAIYVADVGQNQMWSCGNYIMRNGRFFTSGGMGTMGYSIPAALGAKLADKKKQVIAVIGDGAFQMCFMELATMRQYDVPVKIAVIKNGWLGLVRQYQHFTYNDRFSVTDLSGSPELSKIAEAYGMKYIRMANNSEMSEKLDDFLDKDESVLMEVLVDPSEIA